MPSLRQIPIRLAARLHGPLVVIAVSTVTNKLRSFISTGGQKMTKCFRPGDAFDPQFEEFAESGEVVPKLLS